MPTFLVFIKRVMHIFTIKVDTGSLRNYVVRLTESDSAKACCVLWCSQKYLDIWICLQKLLLLDPCLMFSFKPSDHLKAPWQGKLSFTARRIHADRKTEISSRSDMLSTDIRAHSRYLQLSGNICRLTEDCQAGRVNNMLTSISHPHVNQACQSHESSLRLRFRRGWKKSAPTAPWVRNVAIYCKKRGRV